jgi:hypothetical protein
MKQEIKADWGQRLLDNAGRQGRGGALHRRGDAPDGSQDTFCCLGVLCELGVQAGVVRRELTDDGEAYRYVSTTDENDRSYLLLPQAVVRWAGLDSRDPFILGGSVGGSLSELNDGGTTFPEIKALIDRYL